MTVASLCVILLILWTLLAYTAIPLPVSDPIFAWLRRQWLFEGIGGLTCLAVLASAWSLWRRRSLPRISWWPAWGVWIIWAAVSLAFSIDRGNTVRSWVGYAAYGLLAFVTGTLVRSPRDLLIWLRFLVAIAVVTAVRGLLQYFGTFDETLSVIHHLDETGGFYLGGWQGAVVEDFLRRKRIVSVFGWPNLFAGFLVFMIPLAIGLSAHSRRPIHRMLWGLAGGLLAACLILTLSMGGWMAAMLTGSLAWWFVRSGRARLDPSAPPSRKPLTWALAVGLLLCAVVSVTSFILAKRAQPLIRASVGSRLAYARGAWNVMRERPLTGTGLGTFGLAYQALKPLERSEGQHEAVHAHNTLLELGAELGLIGLLAFLGFLWPVGRLITVMALGRGPPAIRPLVRGLAIGVLGFFLYSLIEQTFVEHVTAPFWWVGLGLLTGADGLETSDQTRVASWRERIILVGAPAGLALIGLTLAVRLAIADGWAARAAMLAQVDDSQARIRAYASAERWDPLTSRYAMEQGEEVLRRIGRMPLDAARPLLMQAQERFGRAARLSPWLSVAWQRLGLTSWQLGQSDKAIEAMEHAARRDPNARSTLAHLAGMLTATGGFSRLIDVAQRFQRLEPASPQGYFWEAVGLEGLGETERAGAGYQSALDRAPEFYPALFQLAALRRHQGELAEATRLYEAFLRLAPSTDVAVRAIAQEFLESSR